MKQESIVKNYGYKLIYQMVTFMVPLVSTPYLARVFGADGVGIQSYTNAIVSYFILFAALGTEIYGSVEIAKVRDNKEKLTNIFWGILVVRFLSTTFCLITWLVYICFATKYQFYFVALSVQILAVSIDITWFYEGMEQYKLIVRKNIAIKFINLAFVFTFVRSKQDLGIYIISLGIFILLGNFSLWLDIKRRVGKFNRKELFLKQHINGTLIYFIPTIATSIYTVLDKAMIGWITNSELQNGYYEQAAGIVMLAKKLSVTLPVVMRPRMSYLFANGKVEELKTKLYKSMNYVLTISLLITFGLMGTAKQFIPWYLGAGYEPVIQLLFVKSALIFIITLSMCVGEECLTPIGQRARSSRAIIVGSVINFLLNLTLIPKFGAMGASIASVLAELLITILYLYMGKEYLPIRLVWKCLWKKFIAAFVMFLFLISLFSNASSKWYVTLLQMVSGSVVYFIILLLIKDSIITEVFYVLKNIVQTKRPEKRQNG